MTFDDLLLNIILYTVSYGYYLIILFCLLKIILLLWFQKGNLPFVLKNFFYINTDMVQSGDLDLTKGWVFFRKTYRVLSFLIYGSTIIWFIFFMLYRRISGTAE